MDFKQSKNIMILGNVMVILFVTGIGILAWKLEVGLHDESKLNNLHKLPIGAMVYESETLGVKKLSEHVYVHISFLETIDFGRVTCNGMLVVYGKEAVIFDTTTHDNSSDELIEFVDKGLGSTIIGIVPTHFHDDCLGGIRAFQNQNIPVFLNERTLRLLKEKGKDKLVNHPKTFDRAHTMLVGDGQVIAEYYGQGHTEDNIIGYVPDDKVLFGGCLIKTLGAGKGYLGDANTGQWSTTVQRIMLGHPKPTWIIPGHGALGGRELLDYTIALFENSTH